MFYIYKHTSPTGKSYIGQTTEINRRWSPMRYEGCKKFFYAIMMHGWNNFTHEILAECETQEGEEIYCEYRREAKDKIGVCGAHIPKYIRENKLYKNRYRFKEVA